MEYAVRGDAAVAVPRVRSFNAVEVGEASTCLGDDHGHRGDVPWVGEGIDHRLGSAGGDQGVAVGVAPRSKDDVAVEYPLQCR